MKEKKQKGFEKKNQLVTHNVLITEFFGKV